MNENAKLKVKQNEDSKLWQVLDPKISSTKTLCDQLIETLQQLASQTEQGNIHGNIHFAHLLKQYTYSRGRYRGRIFARILKIWMNSTACCKIYQQNWSVQNKRSFQVSQSLHNLLPVQADAHLFRTSNLVIWLLNFDVFCTSVSIDILLDRIIHIVLISLK